MVVTNEDGTKTEKSEEYDTVMMAIGRDPCTKGIEYYFDKFKRGRIKNIKVVKELDLKTLTLSWQNLEKLLLTTEKKQTLSTFMLLVIFSPKD